MALATRRTRALSVAAVALVLIAGAAGCGSNDESGEPTETKIGSGATVDSTTTPVEETPEPETEPSVTEPTTPSAPLGLFGPRESAQALYDAWKADDRATAATLGEPTAVEGQWATAPGDYSLYNDCDSGEFGTSGCLFRGSAGTIQYTMERREDRWVVIETFFAAP